VICRRPIPQPAKFEIGRGEHGVAVVRRATAIDAARIAELHTASWRSAYKDILGSEYLETQVELDHATMWRARLTDEPSSLRSLLLVAEEGTTLVGFIYAILASDPTWGTLVENLHVRPEFRSKGFGSLLMHRLGQLCIEQGIEGGIFLWVYNKNIKARRFYAGHGAQVRETNQALSPDGLVHDDIRLTWNSWHDLLNASGGTLAP